ncbi:MAG: 4-hydroxyphenylacetate decarboxylase activating enzyme [Promethearchaeota archaeon]|nr:MAG: 4-hydroxyphenylacetate decarboxylase activating enzyme [Candidatus Lokiarchaeota archaeon]
MSEIGNLNKALIFEIQHFSTEDGPGIRTSIFMKQCPLRCKWCHNPESISKAPILEWLRHKCIGCKTCIEVCEREALSFDGEGIQINRKRCTGCGECEKECPSTALHLFGKWWSIEDLFKEIEKDKVYYSKSKGGITISGGEPTQQAEFTKKFLNKCKKKGISTALDTCGYTTKKIYKQILPYVDLILLDIKEIDSEKHQLFTGVSNELILENAIWLTKYVKRTKKKIWIRTPIIPHYTATTENIKRIGEFIVNKLENIPDRWDLLSFNKLCSDKYKRLDLDWKLNGVPFMASEEMEKFYNVAKNTGVQNVHWSGPTKNTNEDIISKEKRKDLKLPSY